jgi:hypothetical protein
MSVELDKTLFWKRAEGLYEKWQVRMSSIVTITNDTFC